LTDFFEETPVSSANIVGFAEILVDNEMRNEIVGSNDDDCVIIDVCYSRENRGCLEELEAFGEIED